MPPIRLDPRDPGVLDGSCPVTVRSVTLLPLSVFCACLPLVEDAFVQSLLNSGKTPWLKNVLPRLPSLSRAVENNEFGGAYVI